MRATAVAHPNIAVCKYWGKRDIPLNLPAVPSLSLTVAPFHTTTTVTWGAEQDAVTLNGKPADAATLRKVQRVLSLLDPARPPCVVDSVNSFPTAAGLASSSSGFAALVVAAAAAAGRTESPGRLGNIARQGSGSATRSLHGGWVEWPMGDTADDSHGVPVASPEHWDVRMLVAVLGSGPKPVLSTDGMEHTRRTSNYYDAWVRDALEDIAPGKAAILARDLEALGSLMERSTLRMHACMLAADPALIYFRPETLAVIEGVRALRRQGVGAWFTIDAGPNVKVLCASDDAPKVQQALAELAPRVEVLWPGQAARIVG